MKTQSTCQFDLALPESIRRNFCGISSMWKVFSVFGKHPPDVVKIFNDYVSFGKYTLPTIDATFQNSELVSVPVMFVDRAKTIDDQLVDARKLLINGDIGAKVEVVNHNDSEYLPTFLLDRGSDSRGVSSYMNFWGLKNKLVELTEIGTKEFIDLFNKHSKNKYIIASLCMDRLDHLTQVVESNYKNSAVGLTHLVVVVPSDSEDTFTIWDSAICEDSNALVSVKKEELLEALAPKERKNPHFIVLE